MRMAGTREASQAAFGWPPSGPDDATDAQRAEIAQRKGRPPASAAQRKGKPTASAAQPTEAEKQGRAFIATMEKLPKFVRTSDGCIIARNKVVLELAQYNKYIVGRPPDLKPADPDLREKLLADIGAQGGRISLGTLERLAKVKDMAGIRDELKRVRKEVDGLVTGERAPSRLAEYCLNLQINILIARSKQFKGPFERTTVDEVLKLLQDLKDGIGDKLHQRARHPYDRSGAI